MKKNLSIFLLTLLFFSNVYSQTIINLQEPIPSSTLPSNLESPLTPSSYTWRSVSNTLQGINIHLPPTEKTVMYLQQTKGRLAFNVLYSGQFMLQLYLNYDNQGYNKVADHTSESYGWFTPPSNFTTIGEHNLKVKYILFNGSIVYREYTIIIIPDCTEFHKEDLINNSLTVYDNGNSIPKKPFLIVEGFDPQNNTFGEFYYKKADRLVEKLMADNYRVYFLDFEYNFQSLRNNAAIVHSAINYISLINNNQTVYTAGLSMGGVILRYTLAKAEHNAINLPVSHFISFDSPHQGAVIPHDLQAYLKSTNGSYDLNTPAAKQLLKINEYSENGVEHYGFYNELNNLNGDGYPHNTINIGIAFSCDLGNPGGGKKWIEIDLTSPLPDFNGYINGLEKLAGSYLPATTAVRDPFALFNGFGTGTVTRSSNYNPTFIPYQSALDIRNGSSKFCISLKVEKSDDRTFFYHDEVPPQLIEPIITALKSSIIPDITTNQHYNFTDKTSNVLANDLEIYGKLLVNKYVSSGQSSQPLPLPTPNSEFRLYTSCQSENINVRNGGEIEIGDISSVNNRGIFEIRSGTTMHLKSGGKLNIANGSKLIIDVGATLRFDQGAIIQLNGSNAELIIRGNLDIDDNTEFTISGGGCLVLGTKSYNNITLGVNSKITIDGTGLNNHMLKIEEGSNPMFPWITNNEPNPALITIKNGSVYIPNSSAISFFGRTTLLNTTFNGGVVTIGGSRDVTIDNCHFENNIVGLNAVLDNGDGFPLTLNNCTFQDAATAIKVTGKGFKINNSTITDCQKGVEATGLIFASEIKNSTISRNSVDNDSRGIVYTGSSTAPLYLSDLTINNFASGVTINQSTLFAKCTDITNVRSAGIVISNFGTLDIGKSGRSFSGNNNISLGEESIAVSPIRFEFGNIIDMSHGANRIVQNEPNSYYYIYGRTNRGVLPAMQVKGNNWFSHENSGSFATPSNNDFYIFNVNPHSASPINWSPIQGNSTPILNCFSVAFRNDPCGDPTGCAGEHEQEWLANPLDFCINCTNIELEGYESGQYNEVVKRVLNDIKNLESNTSLQTHIANLLHLYNSDTQVDSPDVTYLREIVYQESLELFGRILIDASLLENLSENGTIEQILNDFSNTQTSRTTKAQLYSDTRIEFFTLMESGQLLASLGDLTGAINEFESAIILGNEEIGEKTYAEHWKCLTYNKMLISNGTYTMDKLDSLLKGCPEIIINEEDMPSLKVANPIFKDSLYTQIKTQILGYPNPTNGDVSFLITLDEITEISYSIFDINGRKVYEKNPLTYNTGISNVIVDFAQYPNGVYNCMLKIGAKTFNNKIVVIR